MDDHFRTRVWHLLYLLLTIVLMAAGGVSGQEAPLFALAEDGSYAVGTTMVTFVDEARAGREVRVRLLYPAVPPPDAVAGRLLRDAPPDLSGAPYPLILTGRNTAEVFAHHLPSHGYVMAAVMDSFPVTAYDEALVRYPRDLILTLNQLTGQPPADFAGVIDTDQVGALGYSWDGYGALSVSGAQADPAYYLSVCAEPDLERLGYPDWWNAYACAPAQNWEAFKAEASVVEESDTALWPAITHSQIRAVAPMGPEGALWFGPRGLAPVEMPVLIISATEDESYAPEAATIYREIGSADRRLISFVGEDHMMIMDSAMFARISHFVTAFFGYYLQGREDYAELMSQSFVEQAGGLAWGPYPRE